MIKTKILNANFFTGNASFSTPLLPVNVYGRRTYRKIAKNVYPSEKVVSVAMEAIAEGIRSV